MCPYTPDGRIQATRYLVRMRDITSTKRDRECMVEATRLADESSLKVTAFMKFFVHHDQYLYILPGTLQNLGLALACMLLVSLLLIPKPQCSLWVTLSIVCTELGVVGYMALWGVKLQSVSMICLVMCIGFCVDFSAHITFAYSTASVPRLPNALRLLGVATLCGGFSTLLGVLQLVYFNAYIFRTFFKIMFLVIVFGLLHGLVFLPVWLDTFFLFKCRKEDSPNDSERKSVNMPRQNLGKKEYAENGEKEAMRKDLEMKQLAENGEQEDMRGDNTV